MTDMTELAKAFDSSAQTWAAGWLEAVIVNDHDDPEADAAIWTLTHESWRRAIASAFLGPDSADVGNERDVTLLDDWIELARFAVEHVREALPPAVRAMGVGGCIKLTDYVLPHALDRVQVVMSDQPVEIGHYWARIGSRVGFALTMVREEEGWTVEDVEADWHFPQWLATERQETA